MLGHMPDAWIYLEAAPDTWTHLEAVPSAWIHLEAVPVLVHVYTALSSIFDNFVKPMSSSCHKAFVAVIS